MLHTTCVQMDPTTRTSLHSSRPPLATRGSGRRCVIWVLDQADAHPLDEKGLGSGSSASTVTQAPLPLAIAAGTTSIISTTGTACTLDPAFLSR